MNTDTLINIARRILIGTAFLGGLALAIDYRVDAEGGPPNLADAVDAAFSTWRGTQGANVEANVTEEAPNLIEYGGAADFGPETYSLTVQRTEDDTRSVNVLINPTLEPQNDLRRRALLHETGVLLGLSTLSGDATGVMNPSFSAGAAANLSEADRAAIAELESFAAEDVNRDGVVNFYDLADLAADFGQSGVSLPGDINADGVVDDDDIARLREAYVFDAPAQTDPNTGSETGGATGGEDDLEDELTEFGDITGGAFGDDVTGGAFGDDIDNEEDPGGETEDATGSDDGAQGDTGGADE